MRIGKLEKEAEKELTRLEVLVERMMNENETLRDLEKQYCERLGELARLADVVCTGVYTQNLSAEVIAAADEIMEYVEAVRPG